MMHPLIAYIRASALHWSAYKFWTEGSIHIRQFEMHMAMRDIVLAGTLYKLERRKQPTQ